MTTPQGMLEEAKAIAALANRIEELKPFNAKSPDGAEWERYVINVSPTERDRVVTALRQAAAPQERGAIDELRKHALAAADGIDLLQDSRHLRRRTAEILRELVAALTPAVAPDGGREPLIEQLAQWLHDETNDPDNFPGYAWPLHPNDTGRRSADGWVHVVPIDVVEEFRATAKRLVARFGTALSRPSPPVSGMIEEGK